MEHQVLEAKVAREGNSTSLCRPFRFAAEHETSSFARHTAILSMLARTPTVNCSYVLARLQLPRRRMEQLSRRRVQQPLLLEAVKRSTQLVVSHPPTFSTTSLTNLSYAEITIDAIVKMIKQKQEWPPAIKAAFAGTALAKDWDPPSKLNPCDPELCNHPSTHAVEVLKSGNIPAEIMAAIKDPANGWTKKGAAGAAGAKGGSVKGTSTAGAAGVAGAAGANGASVKGSSTAGAPAAKGSKPKRNAQLDASFYDSELFARYAYPEAFYDNELFTRDVDDSYNDLFSRDAKPEYYEDLDLYARNAEAEFDDDLDLYARDAEPEFDDYSRVYRRDAEAWYDDREVFARDEAPAPAHEEAVAHMTEEDMKKLFHTLQTNKKAQAAVMKVVNEDPYLAHYAHELEDNYD